jgi:hypothetical protein
VILGTANTKGWQRATAIDKLRYPGFIHGDMCAMLPGKSSFDIVMSWSCSSICPILRRP